MAKANGKAKHLNGKQNGVNIKRALELIGESQGQLYALSEFGRVGEKLQLGSHAVEYSITALCNRTREFYAQAIENVPTGHSAIQFLKNAAAALDTLEYVVRMVNEAEGGGAGTPPLVFRNTVTKCARAFVGESGRWMERAEVALGEKFGSCGYLDGMLIDGGEGMAINRNLEAALAIQERAKQAEASHAH